MLSGLEERIDQLGAEKTDHIKQVKELGDKVEQIVENHQLMLDDKSSLRQLQGVCASFSHEHDSSGVIYELPIDINAGSMRTLRLSINKVRPPR